MFVVEVPGFEPGSFSVLTGLLRVQPVVGLGPAFATGAGGGSQPAVDFPGQPVGTAGRVSPS